MALFDSLRGRKEAPPAPKGPPVDQVLQMQAQNMTNNQIVEALQRDGYDMNTIMDAIAQAEAVGSVQQAPQSAPMPAPPAPTEEGTHVEELVEKIVDERWQELQKEQTKTAEWRDTTTSRIERIEQSLQDTKTDLDNLHRAIISKISDYDKNLVDVGTEIKAMEKVFQKVLPTLTENVAELSRVTEIIRSQPIIPIAPEAKKKRKEEY